MENTQILELDPEQQFQEVLNAIKDFNGKQVGTEEYDDAYNQLQNCIKNLNWNSLSAEEAEQIVDAMERAEIKIEESVLNIFLYRCQLNSLNAKFVKKIFNIIKDDITFYLTTSNGLLGICAENSLDADCVKMFLERNQAKFDYVLLAKFLNACGENSLNGKNLENLYHNCSKSSFKDYSKGEIASDLNETSKRLFQKLCNLYEEEKLPERKSKNKKLGILGSIGVIFGGLFGSGAIGLGVAIGTGALVVTIAAPIAAAVVGLVLMGIFGYVIDKFRVNKVLNEIKEAKLNGKEVNEKKIPLDLSKRKEIQNALDNSKDPLLQNAENERTQ